MEKEPYLHSINLNIHTDFPYLVLEVVNDHSYPRNPGFQVMHWHADLQFLYVWSGMVEIQTLDRTLRAEAGEGVFINKDVVHNVRRVGDCHYYSFLFPARFLTFYVGSPAEALTDSITGNTSLPLCHLARQDGWCGDVLAGLRRLVELEKRKGEFYEYEVLVQLCTLWLVMRKNMALPPKQRENTVNARVKKILCYMEQHYAEDLTLTRLAESANISKSECYRCFRMSLDTAPYQYLMEIRLSKAAQLLRETEEPVGRIAASTGFHQVSHFGKCFREKTGYSPREYRRIKGQKQE